MENTSELSERKSEMCELGENSRMREARMREKEMQSIGFEIGLNRSVDFIFKPVFLNETEFGFINQN